MAGWIRLQDSITLAGGEHKQSLEDAIDTGDYAAVVLCIRRSVYDRSLSYLWIQHAPLLEEAAFQDLATLSLSVPGAETIVLQNTLRYIRWRADIGGMDDPSFVIDLIGREA